MRMPINRPPRLRQTNKPVGRRPLPRRTPRLLRKRPSLKERVFEQLKNSVDTEKLKSSLHEKLTIEAGNLADAGAHALVGKVSEYLPFATATGTKIAMQFVKQKVSEAMTGVGSPGSLSMHQGVSGGFIAGKKVNNYAMSFNFAEPRSKQLKHLISQNAVSKLQVAPWADSSTDGDAAKMFFQSGINSKNVCQWQTLPNSSAGGWQPADQVKLMQEFPLSWNVTDDENCITADPGLPSWADMISIFGDSDQSIQYPIVSRHLDFQLFNSNAFTNVKIKIYLCKRKRDGFVPASDWFTDPLLGQNQNRMNDKWVNKWDSEPGDNIFTLSGSGNWVRESSINLNAYPGMSSNFQQRWEIVEVRSQILEAFESLNVTTNIEAGDLFDMRNVIAQKRGIQTSITSSAWPYAFMIEHQGQNGLVVPRQNVQNITVDGSPLLVDAMTSKIRFRYRKYAKLAYGSIQPAEQSNITTKTFTDSDGNTVQIPLGPMAGVIKKNTSLALPYRYYSPYRNLSDKTGTAGQYYIPVYTDQEQQVAAPLANQQ